MPRSSCRFDRYLDPSTAVRQAMVVYSGSEDNAVFLEPQYDLVERVVRYRHFSGLTFTPGVLYTVELIVPSTGHPDGFRAFDGAPIAEGEAPLRFNFRTRESTAPEPPPRIHSRLSGHAGAVRASHVDRSDVQRQWLPSTSGTDAAGLVVRRGACHDRHRARGPRGGDGSTSQYPA